MFTIIKDKYIRCFVGLFVFIFLSVATCNSYASVCFLPTGDCSGDSDSLETSGALVPMPEICPKEYPYETCPQDRNCDEKNGCYKINESKAKDEEPKCTTSCTPEDGHRTCTTDSKGCPIVGKECLDDKYLTLQACKNDNNGADCKLVGTCYEVRIAPEPSGSCDGYNVAKSTLVALQTAFGVSSFDTFMSNLSTYTLEQCTACPADSTKFKCSYVGCPAGKTLYLNFEMAQNGARSMLSNTNITDYEEFSLEPIFFQKRTPVRDSTLPYAESCIRKKIYDNTLPDICVKPQFCSNALIGLLGPTSDGMCVIKEIECPIVDPRSGFKLSDLTIERYDGDNCSYSYNNAIKAGESEASAKNKCERCMAGLDNHDFGLLYTNLEPEYIDYARSDFSFVPFDKTKRNIAININGCDISTLENCLVNADFSDMLVGTTHVDFKDVQEGLSRYETSLGVTSLCLDKNSIDSDYVDVYKDNLREITQKLMILGLNNQNSKYYGKEDWVDYHVYVEPQKVDSPEVEETECPDDKICFKFHYICNGEPCSKDFFIHMKSGANIVLTGHIRSLTYPDGYIDYYNPIPTIDESERLYEFDVESEGVLYYYDDETGELVEKQESLWGNNDSSDILDFTMLTLDKRDMKKNEVTYIDFSAGSDYGNFWFLMDDFVDGTIDGLSYGITHSPDDDKTLIYRDLGGYYGKDVYNGLLTLTKRNNIINIYADITEELIENPTRSISIIAKCNKFSEINCSEQPGGGDASYMSEAEQACYNVNNLGCIAPSLQYTENGEIKEKSPDSQGQIYTDSAGNEYIMTAKGLKTLKFVDVSFIDDVTPTDKFMYTFNYVPLGTEYTATIIPIKVKAANGSVYQLFREFVFEDLREYATVDFNTPRSGNVIYTLDKDNLGNDLTLYPVIDYEYRIFAYLNDDRESIYFGSGSADSLITAITINGPVMKYYNRSIPNSLPDRSPFIDMPVDNSACNQYGGEKDIVATKGSCGNCYLQSANAGSDTSGNSLNLITDHVSIGDRVWDSATNYNKLKENFFSWPKDDDIYDGIYVTNEYYSGETPYSSCELKTRTLYSYFTNEDALMNAGPVYENGMTKLVSFNNTASENWSIWGTYYPIGSFAVVKYQETRSKEAKFYVGIKALRARCLNYGSSGVVDGVYHRYNGFNCDEMYY